MYGLRMVYCTAFPLQQTQPRQSTKPAHTYACSGPFLPHVISWIKYGNTCTALSCFNLGIFFLVSTERLDNECCFLIAKIWLESFGGQAFLYTQKRSLQGIHSVAFWLEKFFSWNRFSTMTTSPLAQSKCNAQKQKHTHAPRQKCGHFLFPQQPPPRPFPTQLHQLHAQNPHDIPLPFYNPKSKLRVNKRTTLESVHEQRGRKERTGWNVADVEVGFASNRLSSEAQLQQGKATETWARESWLWKRCSPLVHNLMSKGTKGSQSKVILIMKWEQLSWSPWSWV